MFSLGQIACLDARAEKLFLLLGLIIWRPLNPAISPKGYVSCWSSHRPKVLRIAEKACTSEMNLSVAAWASNLSAGEPQHARSLFCRVPKMFNMPSSASFRHFMNVIIPQSFSLTAALTVMPVFIISLWLCGAFIVICCCFYSNGSTIHRDRLV